MSRLSSMRTLQIYAALFLLQTAGIVWAVEESPETLAVHAALADFAARKDSMSRHEEGIVLIRQNTSTWGDRKPMFYTLVRKPRNCTIASELIDATLDSNQAEESAAAMLKETARWRLLRHNDMENGYGFLDKTTQGQPIKTIATLFKPGVSKTGDAALVMFAFQWSRHGAYANYVVQKIDNEWKVQCSDLMFFP